MGRNTLEIPPWTTGFLERFQVATELAVHLPNPPGYSVTEEEPNRGSLGRDKVILPFHQNVTSALGWKLVESFSGFSPVLGTPATSRCRPHTGASLAALLRTKTMPPLTLAAWS